MSKKTRTKGAKEKPTKAKTSEPLGSGTYVSEVQNTTTSAELTKGENFLVVSELTEDGMKLEVGPNLCALGHNLSFKFIYVEQKQKLEMVATAKILHHQKLATKNELVTLKFHQMDNAVWSKLWKHLERRQLSADELFQKLKDF